MNARWKITAILIAIVFASGLAGGFGGFQLAKAKYRKRSNPEDWNVAAMRSLENGLHLTPEQRVKMQAILDGGVEEFKTIRIDTIAKSNEVLERMILAVDKELTPEQRVEFDKFRAKRVQANLDMLKVEPRKK
jgi:hypothetical protein